MSRTVLIVHPGALGDVLLALPALRALRSAFPRHRHALVAGSEVGRLLKCCTEIDQLIPLEEGVLATLLAGGATVPARVRERLGPCELMVAWMRDAEDRLAAIFQGLAVGRVIVRSPSDREFDGLHQSDRFLQAVRDVVWPGDYRHPLTMAEADLARGRELLAAAGAPRKGIIGLHPGSGSRHKCCAPSLLSAACSALSLRGYQPILLGGLSDEAIVADVVARCAPAPPGFANLDLVTMAAVLAQLDLYVGHDSGLTHLAAALHRPTLAIFGPTQAQQWAPRGSHVRILAGDRCGCATWAEVQACRAKPCLQISADRVVHACEEMVHQRRRLDAGPVWRGLAPCSDR